MNTCLHVVYVYACIIIIIIIILYKSRVPSLVYVYDILRYGAVAPIKICIYYVTNNNTMIYTIAVRKYSKLLFN